MRNVQKGWKPTPCRCRDDLCLCIGSSTPLTVEVLTTKNAPIDPQSVPLNGSWDHQPGSEKAGQVRLA